jgi:hypothetical protein
MNNKVTFELSDLSYEDLLTTYKDILGFINYLDENVVEEEPEKKEEENKENGEKK